MASCDWSQAGKGFSNVVFLIRVVSSDESSDIWDLCFVRMLWKIC